MVLQSSGPISIGDIAAEFGGTAPHSLSEYYGVDTGIPTSGAISIGDFYGASAAPTGLEMTIGYLGTNAGYALGEMGSLNIDPYYVNGARLSWLTQSGLKDVYNLNVFLLGNRGASFFTSITVPEGTYLTSTANYLYNDTIGASTWTWPDIGAGPWFDQENETIPISFVE